VGRPQSSRQSPSCPRPLFPSAFRFLAPQPERAPLAVKNNQKMQIVTARGPHICRITLRCVLTSIDAQGDDENWRRCDDRLWATRELPDQVTSCMTHAPRNSAMDLSPSPSLTHALQLPHALSRTHSCTSPNVPPLPGDLEPPS